jgi:phage-related protein
MSSLTVKLAIIMAQSSSLAASGYVVYTNFKPLETLKWFFTEFLPKKLGQLFDLFIQLIYDALIAVKKALVKILEDAWAAIQYAFNKIKDFVLGIANKIANGAKKIIKDIEKAFTKAFKKIEEGFMNIINTIGDAFKSIPGKITGAGKQVIDKVAGSGKVVVDQVENAGKKIVDDIGSSGKRAVDQIGSGFSNMTKEAGKAFADAPARGAAEARKQFASLFNMR